MVILARAHHTNFGINCSMHFCIPITVFRTIAVIFRGCIFRPMKKISYVCPRVQGSKCNVGKAGQFARCWSGFV